MNNNTHPKKSSLVAGLILSALAILVAGGIYYSTNKETEEAVSYQEIVEKPVSATNHPPSIKNNPEFVSFCDSEWVDSFLNVNPDTISGADKDLIQFIKENQYSNNEICAGFSFLRWIETLPEEEIATLDIDSIDGFVIELETFLKKFFPTAETERIILMYQNYVHVWYFYFPFLEPEPTEEEVTAKYESDIASLHYTLSKLLPQVKDCLENKKQTNNPQNYEPICGEVREYGNIWPSLETGRSEWGGCEFTLQSKDSFQYCAQHTSGVLVICNENGCIKKEKL